jgi:uncharacterized membrane protein (Fun14 family)
MTDPNYNYDAAPRERPGERIRRHIGELAGWKKFLLIGSLILTGVGLVMRVTEKSTAQAPAASSSSGSGQSAGSSTPGRGFVGNEQDQTSDAPSASASQPPPPTAWPAVFRLGLSFFVGFVVAFFLRLFLKTAALIVGLFLLAVFALRHTNLIDLDWAGITRGSEGVLGWLKTQTDSARHFVLGALPSAASGGFGMWVGFRRR